MEQWLDYSDFLDRAQELIDLGLYEEAKSLLEQHQHSFPDDWEIHFLYSRIYAEQNRPEDAIPCLERALLMDPENIDCLVGLFYAYAMVNQIGKGSKHLFEAEKLQSDHELVLSALVWYYTETNNLPQAIACFERIRSKGTTNPETFRNGGIAYDRIGEYEKATECFKAALDIHHSYDEVRELLSDLYIATERAGKAIELYREALDESPQNIRYLSRLAYCLTQNNEIQKAIDTAEETIRLYPNSPIGYIDLAYAWLNNGDLEKALSAADKALDIAPLDAESFRVKAIILSDLGNNDEAEKSFTSAASLDKENIEILRDYYNHLRRVGNDVKMEEVIGRVIERNDPSCIEDYWFLADYYKEKKEYIKSLHFLHKAFKIRPGENDLLLVVADICIATGHTSIALRFISKFVAQAGWNDALSQMVTYPQLQKRQIQEGLRFFRYYGEKPDESRKFLFSQQFKRAAIISFDLVILAAVLPLFVLFGRQTAQGVTTSAIIAAVAILAFNIATRRWGEKLFRI